MKNEIRKEIYDRQFKLKFMGYGDWIDEPDWVKFEYVGFNCLIARVVKREPYANEEAYFGGHLCGYIFLPDNHPLHGKPIDEIDLDCHGGITWSELTDEGCMIGFDCGHSMDLIPTMEQQRCTRGGFIDFIKIPEEYKKLSLFNPTYKNLSFCIKECKKLAKQAAKMIAAV